MQKRTGRRGLCGLFLTMALLCGCTASPFAAPPPLSVAAAQRTLDTWNPGYCKVAEFFGFYQPESSNTRVAYVSIVNPSDKTQKGGVYYAATFQLLSRARRRAPVVFDRTGHPQRRNFDQAAGLGQPDDPGTGSSPGGGPEEILSRGSRGRPPPAPGRWAEDPGSGPGPEAPAAVVPGVRHRLNPRGKPGEAAKVQLLLPTPPGAAIFSRPSLPIVLRAWSPVSWGESCGAQSKSPQSKL